MYRLITIISIVTLMISWPGVAEAQSRVALVIGNGDYDSVGGLPNPPNDARLMASTLRGLGFEVIEQIDASQKSMKRSIRDFGKSLRGGGEDSVGLFYFAGHGVQVKGVNYIIPVDAVIEQEGDVDLEAIDANAVLSMMEHSGVSLNFVILDACRNNPFSRSFRSGSRGLAEMDAPTGSYIAYATSPGDVAADGSGVNSPYTEALTNAMRVPGVEVELMFKKVRNFVREATNNAQTPWESSSLIGGDFFFNTAGVREDAPSASATTSNSQQGNQNSEIVFWQTIQNSTDPTMFEAYLSQYPSGSFAPLAKAKISALGLAQVAAISPTLEFNVTALDQEMIAVKTANVREEPSTRGDKIGTVSKGTLLNVTGQTSVNSATWYRVALTTGQMGYVFGSLLDDPPSTSPSPETDPPVQEATRAPDMVVWNEIKNSTDVSDYEFFMQQYPNSPLSPYAQIKIDKLMNQQAATQTSLGAGLLDTVSSHRQKALEAAASAVRESNRANEAATEGRKAAAQARQSPDSNYNIYTWDSGSRYEGELIDGDFNGQGVKTMDTGNRYEGDFKDDQFSGNGIYIWVDGSEYSGQLIGSYFDGYGILTNTDGGARYEGNWLDDLHHGHGVKSWASGDRYEGEFKEGELSGFGTYLWKSGVRYEGEFRNGDFNGRGVKTFLDGTIEEGIWADDELIEPKRVSDSQQASLNAVGSNTSISKLRGVNIWYRTNANAEVGRKHCRLLEDAGLIVQCDYDYIANSDGLREIYLGCASLPDDTGEILQTYLGISGYGITDLRQHEDYGANANEDYCDKFDALDIATGS